MQIEQVRVQGECRFDLKCSNRAARVQSECSLTAGSAALRILHETSRIERAESFIERGTILHGTRRFATERVISQ